MTTTTKADRMEALDTVVVMAHLRRLPRNPAHFEELQIEWLIAKLEQACGEVERLRAENELLRRGVLGDELVDGMQRAGP